MEIAPRWGRCARIPDLAQPAGFRKVRHAHHDPPGPDGFPRDRDGGVPHQGAHGRGVWPDCPHGDPQPSLLPPHPHRRGRPTGPAGRSPATTPSCTSWKAGWNSKGVGNSRPSNWPCTRAAAITSAVPFGRWRRVHRARRSAPRRARGVLRSVRDERPEPRSSAASRITGPDAWAPCNRIRPSQPLTIGMVDGRVALTKFAPRESFGSHTTTQPRPTSSP